MAEESRQQRGEATRRNILNVARRLFSDFGYHNTGIADIQAATGLTKGAFYHHYRAKQELALAVLEAVREDYETHLFGPATAAPVPGRRLGVLLDRFVELNHRPDWPNCRLLATWCAEINSADGPLAHQLQALQDDLLDQLATMVSEAQESRFASPGPAAIWAHMILSTLFGLVLIRKSGVSQPRVEEIVDALKRAVLAGSIPQESADPDLPKVVHLPEDADYF